ncbi:MAG: biliverdin-producing heme oxygenase [Planctomycetes bacterium]|nr:biliverdin-producing heme oxygenase [Planctomycetota bacterium]
MLFEHLKQSTATAHRRLEASLDWMSPDFSRDDYQRLLRHLLGFLQPWESQVARFVPGDMTAMFDERRKTPLLERDVAALDDPSSKPIEFAAPEQLPYVDSPAAAWGSWYVVEGSTLGGQLLARHFHARWNLSEAAGLTYFTGYGSQTGARWAEFRRMAEASLDAAAYAAAAVAAGETFEKFGAWLTAAPAEQPAVAESRRISRNPA